MYIIKKITVDGKNYISSQILSHFGDEFAQSSIMLLEEQALSLVKEEYGAIAFSEAKIIKISNEDQVMEPIVDTMLLYSIDSDPTRIHVYQRKSAVIESSAWFYGTVKTAIPTFKKTYILEIESYGLPIMNNNSTLNKIPRPPPSLPIEVISVGSAGLKIATNSLIASVTRSYMEELIKSSRFIQLQQLNE